MKDKRTEENKIECNQVRKSPIVLYPIGFSSFLLYTYITSQSIDSNKEWGMRKGVFTAFTSCESYAFH